MVPMSEPRRLLLSWQPTPDNEDVKKWLERFKVHLKAERRKIEVLDAREPGQDRAWSRDQKGYWSDFVSVLTVDYVTACEKQPDHELRWALPQLRAEIPAMRFWAVRLADADPSDWGMQIGPDLNVDAPWDKSLRWHYLPEFDKVNRRHLHVDATDLDTPIERDCISRLREHVVQCAICRGDAAASAPVEPPVAGILHRVQRFFRRP